MRQTNDQLQVTNVNGSNLFESFGIAPERAEEVKKQLNTIVKEELDKNSKESVVIARVYNEFENPVECSICLFVLNSTETEVSIRESFRLPEVVSGN